MHVKTVCVCVCVCVCVRNCMFLKYLSEYSGMLSPLKPKPVQNYSTTACKEKQQAEKSFMTIWADFKLWWCLTYPSCTFFHKINKHFRSLTFSSLHSHQPQGTLQSQPHKNNEQNSDNIFWTKSVWEGSWSQTLTKLVCLFWAYTRKRCHYAVIRWPPGPKK